MSALEKILFAILALVIFWSANVLPALLSAGKASEDRWQVWRNEAKTPEQREVAAFVESTLRSKKFSCLPDAEEPRWLGLTYPTIRDNMIQVRKIREKNCARVLNGQIRVMRGDVADFAFAKTLLTRIEQQS